MSPTPAHWSALVAHLARVGVAPKSTLFLGERARPRFDVCVDRDAAVRLDYRATRHVWKGEEWLAGSVAVGDIDITIHTEHVPHDETAAL